MSFKTVTFGVALGHINSANYVLFHPTLKPPFIGRRTEILILYEVQMSNGILSPSCGIVRASFERPRVERMHLPPCGKGAPMSNTV